MPPGKGASKTATPRRHRAGARGLLCLLTSRCSQPIDVSSSPGPGHRDKSEQGLFVGAESVATLVFSTGSEIVAPPRRRALKPKVRGVLQERPEPVCTGEVTAETVTNKERG